MGLKAGAAAAKQSASSMNGSNGGVCTAVKANFQAEALRELAKPDRVAKATVISGPATHMYEYNDWIPIIWHMKGYSIALISCYLDGGGAA